MRAFPCAPLQEGADFGVMQGARAALAAGRVQALQFEANFKWCVFVGVGRCARGDPHGGACPRPRSCALSMAAPAHALAHSRPPLPHCAHREKMVGPKTLVEGVRFLERSGFDVFIISRSGPWQPISGDLWHSAYEQCAETWDRCVCGGLGGWGLLWSGWGG